MKIDDKFEDRGLRCCGTTSYATIMDIRILQMELWLWRAYAKGDSDIFGTGVRSENNQYRLCLSDGHYLLENVVSQKIGKKKVPASRSFGNHLGDLIWVIREGFSLASIFFGFLDHLMEEPDTFKEIIEEMISQVNNYSERESSTTI